MINENLKNQIEHFVTSLKNYNSYKEYEKCLAANNSDEELNKMRAEFGKLRKHFMENQNNGNVTQEEINRLRELQTQINSHPTVRNLIDSQNQLIMILQHCNRRISEEIGLDFAQNSAPSSCCG